MRIEIPPPQRGRPVRDNTGCLIAAILLMGLLVAIMASVKP